MRYAKHLSEVIGPRPAGTPEEFAAARYVQSCFAELGLEARLQPFTFLNWLPLAPPVLEVIRPEPMRLSLAPMGYTLPAPSSGAHGIVRKAAGKMVLVPNYKEWEKYIISLDGEDVGFFVKNPAGEASPFPTSRPMLPEVGAVIGKEEGERIDGWLAAGETVEVRLYSQCVQAPALSHNVVAQLGEGDPVLAVTAHFDSAVYAPGAVDNGSGIQALLDTAAAYRERKDLPPIVFVATGCEEPGLLGGYHFVYDLAERGAMGSLRGCVNFDMISGGERIMVRYGKDMEAHVKAVLADEAGSCDMEYAKPVSDNWPFEVMGIPNVQIVALPFSVYHLPKDTMEVFDEQMQRRAVRIGQALMERIISEKGD